MQYCPSVTGLFFSKLSSRSIHDISYNRIPFFLWLNNISLQVCTTSSSYPSMDIQVFSPLGYCEQCCNEHGSANLFKILIPVLLNKYPEVGCWIIWQFYFSFFEEAPFCFTGTILHLHQHGTWVPMFLHPCQHLLFSGFFDNEHLNRCEVVSRDFDLHLPDDSDVQHLFIYLLYLLIFFGELSIHYLCPFLSWVIWFFAIELYEFLIYFGY